MSSLPSVEPRPQDGSANEPWHVRLYVVGWTPSSLAALRTVKILEAEHFPSGSKVEVIDLLEFPEAGIADNVLAVPMVVRVRPEPVRRIIGGLDDVAKALRILGFSRD